MIGLQFDICYVIKTSVGFENVEITRLLIWKHLKSLKSPSIVKLFVYKTVICEVINVDFSAEIFLWTILQLWLSENVWNYYIRQNECVDSPLPPNFYTKISNPHSTPYRYLQNPGEEPYMGGLGNPLETMLYYLTRFSLWVAIYAFPITEKTKLQNLFPINVTVFKENLNL